MDPNEIAAQLRRAAGDVDWFDIPLTVRAQIVFAVRALLVEGEERS